MTRFPVRSLLVAFVMAWLGAVRATAQPVPPAEPPIYLAWEDVYFVDHDDALAELIDALVRLQPVEKWPTVTVKDEKLLVSITDKYFDIYTRRHPTRSDPGFPITTALLIKAIRDANGLSEEAVLEPDQPLQIPPLPVLAQKSETAIRFFDYETHAYALGQSFHEIPPVGPPKLVNAKDLERERTAYMTVIRVPSREKFDQVFSTQFLQKYRARLLTWSGSISDDQIYHALRVRLLDASVAAAPSVPSQSPYVQHVRDRAARLSSEQRAKAIERAEQFPLVIVDWNFHEKTGHGRRVRAVADLMLDHLGLSFLKTPLSIRHIDLDRSNKGARDQLLALLQEYRDKKGGGLKPGFLTGEAWIRTGSIPVGAPLPPDPLEATYGTTSIIDPFVLNAVLWHIFDQCRACANMSFEVNTTSPPLSDILFTSSGSLCVTAAGNEPGPVPATMFPQNQALPFPRTFFNVSFGTADAINGSTSTSDEDGHEATVAFLAPGSGFADADGVLDPAESGSSFAAPYVAVAAWAKHALDGTLNEEMRKHLMQATAPAPAVFPAIKSAGVLDPALLLAEAIGPRVVDDTGAVVEFREGAVRAELPDGVITTLLTLTGAPGTPVAMTFTPCPESNRMCVWTRRFPSDRVAVTSMKEVRRVTIDGVRLDGSTYAAEQSSSQGAIREIWGSM